MGDFDNVLAAQVESLKEAITRYHRNEIGKVIRANSELRRRLNEADGLEREECSVQFAQEPARGDTDPIDEQGSLLQDGDNYSKVNSSVAPSLLSGPLPADIDSWFQRHGNSTAELHMLLNGWLAEKPFESLDESSPCQAPSKADEDEDAEQEIHHLDKKRRDSLFSEPAIPTDHTDLVSRIVSHPFFDRSATAMIVLSSLLLAVEVEWTCHSATPPALLEQLAQLCNVYFLIEIAFRMKAQGLGFFYNESDRSWNIFDLILVITSIVDFTLSYIGGLGGASLGAVKTLKLVRMVRLFRLFRFFRQLATMAMMIVDSVVSLIWAGVLFAVLIFAFSIMTTSNAILSLKASVDTDDAAWVDTLSNHDDSNIRKVHASFGSIGRSAYTLYATTLSGVNWDEVISAVLEVDVMTGVFMFVWITFSILAVLNVVTANFVDHALQSAQKQRDVKLQEEMEGNDLFEKEVRRMFNAMDGDASGVIEEHEFLELLSDASVAAYFEVLGLDWSDTKKVFRLLDTDGSGCISIDELLSGCKKMKGQAVKMDVMSIESELRVQGKTLQAVVESMSGKRSVAVPMKIASGTAVLSDKKGKFACI